MTRIRQQVHIFAFVVIIQVWLLPILVVSQTPINKGVRGETEAHALPVQQDPPTAKKWRQIEKDEKNDVVNKQGDKVGKGDTESQQNKDKFEKEVFTPTRTPTLRPTSTPSVKPQVAAMPRPSSPPTPAPSAVPLVQKPEAVSSTLNPTKQPTPKQPDSVNSDVEAPSELTTKPTATGSVSDSNIFIKPTSAPTLAAVDTTVVRLLNFSITLSYPSQSDVRIASLERVLEDYLIVGVILEHNIVAVDLHMIPVPDDNLTLHQFDFFGNVKFAASDMDATEQLQEEERALFQDKEPLQSVIMAAFGRNVKVEKIVVEGDSTLQQAPSINGAAAAEGDKIDGTSLILIGSAVVFSTFLATVGMLFFRFKRIKR